jgi:glycosyltransferase involved in cell wall biosynthesis
VPPHTATPSGGSPHGAPAAARRPRILAFAYACDPSQGSEEGAGWEWARLLAGIGETWVLTRADVPTRQAIRRALADLPEAQRPHVISVALRPGRPSRARLGIGPLKRLEYVAWQLRALRVARLVAARHDVDVAWHLTWSNAWIGSTAALLGLPFVYGPVGGGVEPPWRLLAILSPRAVLGEFARTASRGAARYLNPLARASWSRAELILAQNRETAAWFPRSASARIRVFPNAIIETDLRAAPAQRAHPTVVYVGRLVEWKGPGIAIRALAHLPEWRLVLVGAGPAEARLRALAARLGLANRVEFAGQMGREQVLQMMASDADVLLSPSLHDDGPWTIAEAVAIGIPTVALARGGASVFATRRVEPTSPAATTRALAEAVREAHATPVVGEPTFTLEARRAGLVRLLRDAGLGWTG